MTMKRRALLLLTPLAACAALNVHAAAPASTPVQLRLSVQEKTVTHDVQGRALVTWRPLDAAGVRPGDVLRYTLAGTNQGPLPVRGLALTQPVPVGTTLVLRSASGGDVRVTYSVDNGHTFDSAPVVRVLAPGGAVRTVPAPAGAYTDVRWTLTGAVAPAATIQVSYEVKVG